MAMRKFAALTVVLALIVMTACGDSTQHASTTNNNTNINTKTTEAAKSSEHSYTYVETDGNEYSGTYAGEWENNCPHGEGDFIGEGENGKLSLAVSWSNGEPKNMI